MTVSPTAVARKMDGNHDGVPSEQQWCSPLKSIVLRCKESAA